MAKKKAHPSEHNDPELSDLIYEAAIVLLHREIRAHGQVRLTPEDFMLAEEAHVRQQAIVLDYDASNGDVVFMHAKADVGKEVN